MVKENRQIVQAMPLLEGKVNLTSGTHSANELIHCVADGTVTITWATGTTASIDMVAGEDYAFEGDVTITSGTFHIS